MSTMQGVVIGAGPAGLMAAEVMAEGGMAVTVYDRMPSVARKFLLAGRGGLNLTHSEPLERFLARYGDAASALAPAIDQLNPTTLREWAQGLGEATFVGSSGRVFPRSFKTSPLLRAWLNRLNSLGVRIERRARWCGWSKDGQALIQQAGANATAEPVAADAVVLALGGASWPRLGSDGGWVPVFAAEDIPVRPLQPANCGFEIDWSAHLVERFAGTPLKRIVLTLGDQRATGEALVTAAGLEGGAVYSLASAVRIGLAQGPVTVHLDLRPDLDLPSLTARVARPRGSQSLSNHLRKVAALPAVAVSLLHEAGLMPVSADAIAGRIKAVPLKISALRPIERAISSAGGVAWEAVDSTFMLRQRPGTFVAGEMLDWEAPTGGYLLQAVFATGAAAGRGALDWARKS